MALNLREGSVINEALSDAHNKLCSRLHEAIKTYFDVIATAANGERSGTPAPTDDPHVWRANMQRKLDTFESRKKEATEKLDKAVALFSVGAADLEAWIIAAKAADKVRPK